MPEQQPFEPGWNIIETEMALDAFLRTLSAPPRILGLGEPTHGVQDFPLWRNRILRVLVEQHGFRSIAIESDILAGLQVNDFVLGRPNTPNDVLRTGFSHGFGTYQANRELVEWLCEFNAKRNEAEQVRFYGFDAPLETMWAASPLPSLLALHAFLNEHLPELPAEAARIAHLCGEDSRWTNEAAAMDATKSIGRTDEARALRLIADDLQTLLHQETPRLHEEPDFWLAELHARTALGLLRYHANMASSAPLRLERMLALRDLMMADNLSAIAAREQSRGPSLVFAHNSHLQRNRSGWTLGERRLEWWSAGAHLATRMGEKYAFIAATLGSGAGLPEPAPDTLEGHLLQQTQPQMLYATRNRQLPETLQRRTDTPYTYIPLRPEFLHQADGLLFLSTAQEASHVHA